MHALWRKHWGLSSACRYSPGVCRLPYMGTWGRWQLLLRRPSLPFISLCYPYASGHSVNRLSFPILGMQIFLPNTILWGRRVDSCARWSAKRCRVFCKTIDTYSGKSIIVQMKKHTDKAKRILELARHSGVVSTGEVRSEEIHHEYLRQLCREGKLVREGRGLSHRGLYDEVPRAQR